MVNIDKQPLHTVIETTMTENDNEEQEEGARFVSV